MPAMIEVSRPSPLLLARQMPQPDDLFEQSKMSFGEHLEELRTALFKSIAAIAVGFVIGLFFAGKFVQFVSEPLKAAVDQHLVEHAEKTFIAQMKAREAADEPVPKDYEKLAERYGKLSLAPREVLVEPEQVGRSASEADEDGLVPLVLYERVSDDPRRLISTNVTQGFTVYVKAALVIGLVVASGPVFWFIWTFVARRSLSTREALRLRLLSVQHWAVSGRSGAGISSWRSSLCSISYFSFTSGSTSRLIP